MYNLILYIFAIIVVVSAGGVGWMLGSSHAELEAESIRKEDMKLAQKLINEQYERGYKDGFAQKSNAIRREIELDAAKTGKPLYSLVWPNGKGE
jgi:hypothetical protein